MKKVKVLICTEKVVEIPDEVYNNLNMEIKSEEDHNKWEEAGAAMLSITGQKDWAYPRDKAGLLRVTTLDGTILAEA